MRLPHLFVLSALLSVGSVSAEIAPSSQSVSYPAVDLGSMPPGEFLLRDGRNDRPFRLMFDQAIAKPAGESPEVIGLPEGIASVAELRGYLEQQEATDPYTRIHLLAEAADLPETPSWENGGFRSITHKIAFKLVEGARTVDEGDIVASAIGCEHARDHILESGWTALEVGLTSEVFDKLELLRSHPSVEDAYISPGMPMSLRACEFNSFVQFFPNDEYYGYQTYFAPPVAIPNNPWEPFNPWAPIVTVRPIWENADPLTGLPFLRTIYLGTGVTVGVADDGLHTDHPDLRRNINRNLQNDWIGDDSEPTGGVHGTRAGGLIGMIGRNRVGFTGVAPRATLAGLRFFPLTDDGMLDDELIAEVFDYKSGSLEILYNGWGPGDNFLNPVGPGELSMGEIEANVRTRNRIFVIGAGNGASADDTNYDGFASSIYTIPVGSVNPNNQGASYSEVGANIVCATIGQDGPFPSGQLFSTNGAAGYIRGSMDGTSYSAAVLSGIVALMLEANPRLGWRDVQEILIAASIPIGPAVPNFGYPAPIPLLQFLTPAGYTYDTAGQTPQLPNSHSKTGSGFVDATLAVQLAEIWPNLPDGGLYKTRSQRVVDQELIYKRLGPPWAPLGAGRDYDEYDDFHVFYFDFGRFENMRVEHVEVRVEWAEDSDDLPVDIVVFPSDMPNNLFRGLPTEGQLPLLSSRMSRDETFVLAPQDWTYTSVHHWGRTSADTPDSGVWEVHLGVNDTPDGPGDDEGPFTRELKEIQLILHGTRDNTLPTIDSFVVTTTLEPGVPLGPGGQTNSGEDITVSDLEITDPDFDPIRVKYQWQELQGDSVTWVDMPGQSGELIGSCDYDPVAGFEMQVMREGATVFTPSTQPRVNEPVQFISTAFDVGGSIVSHEWDLGDGTTSTLPNPIVPNGYVFPDPITVSLTVTDDTGNTHTFAYTFQVLRDVDPILDPEPIIPPAFDAGTCTFDGELTLPASATSAGRAYRVVLTPFDGQRDGPSVPSDAVIVNSEPVRNTFVGDEYCYDSVLWISTNPPPGFQRFMHANEVSQGTLGPDANGEWIEFMVAVESDMRGYHLINHIAAFDLTFTENEIWKVIPIGTIIVIYNSEFRDPMLPPDDLDPTDDGRMIVGSGNTELFTLPSNGDGWGEVSNGNETSYVLQDRFCRGIDGVAWNTDEEVEGPTPFRVVEGIAIPMVGFIPDGQSAHYYGNELGSELIFDDFGQLIDIVGFLDRTRWHISDATLNPSTEEPPPTAESDGGVTPGRVNDVFNEDVRQQAIALNLTSIPRYSLEGAPEWLKVDEFTGKVTGTPPPGSEGEYDITLVREHSFGRTVQTYTLTVAALPPLDPNEDEDGDSILNMFEIAFASDPFTQDSPADVFPSVLTVPDGGTNHVGIAYRRPTGGVFDPDTGVYTYVDEYGNTYVYEVQYSADLLTWTSYADAPANVITIQSVNPDGPGAEVVTFRLEDSIPGTEPMTYLRVSLTRTAP